MSKKYGVMSVYRSLSQAATLVAEGQVASAIAYKASKVSEAEKAISKFKSGKIKDVAEASLAELW